MKRFLTFILTVWMAMAAFAQTMNVVCGNTVYTIPAAECGNMSYANGNELTIYGKTFAIDDITKIYVDNSTVTRNQVKVTYDDASASVYIPYNIWANLTVGINGAHVNIAQDKNVTEEITYTLSGSSTNGSFYMSGKLKSTITLNGLTLTNPDSAAINIQNGKRIAVVVTKGTVNALTDGSGGSQKGCFVVKGHTEFDGSGTLSITGNTAHAFWGKEYVQLKKGAGTINILKAVKDGFNINQYYQQNGGTVNVSNVGDDGLQVSFKTDDNDEREVDVENTGEVLIKGGTLNVSVTAAGSKGVKAEGPVTINAEKSTPNITITCTGGVLVENNDSSSSVCLKSDSLITIDAGTITLTAKGTGGRAMTCDHDIVINDGTLTARSEGSNYGASSGNPWGGGWPGNPGGNSSSNTKNAKCIKAKGNLTITGGTVSAYSASHEGIESKAVMTISGGTINVQASDDAINATGDLYISGGNIYAYSTSNDGLDSNGNMYISGGVVVAFGGSGAETGVDVDEQHKLSITGGQLFALGGRIDSKFGTCTQAYGYSTRNISLPAGSYAVLSQGTTRIFAVKAPASRNGIVCVSSPSMAKNTTYTVGSSNSVTGTEVNGFIDAPTVSSVSSTVSFTGR